MSDRHNPLSPLSLLASVIVGLVVTIVGGVVVYQLTQARTTAQPSKERDRVARMSPDNSIVAHANNPAVMVFAERAECDQANIRVVIAARIRDSKTAAKIGFVPVSGYFLDPHGKRYESGLTTMENKPMEPMTIEEIKPGETYRYCLGPVTFLDPTMDANCPIKQVTVYLNGLPPRVVAVKEAWWPH